MTASSYLADVLWKNSVLKTSWQKAHKKTMMICQKMTSATKISAMTLALAMPQNVRQNELQSEVVVAVEVVAETVEVIAVDVDHVPAAAVDPAAVEAVEAAAVGSDVAVVAAVEAVVAPEAVNAPAVAIADSDLRIIESKP
jgi:hypothetical protein